MLAKKLIASIAGLAAAAAASAPAFADNGNHYGHYRNYGHNGYPHRVVVQERYYYRPAPRQVVVVQRPAPVIYRPAPVYYQPAPAYYAHTNDAGAALLIGAVLGAAIVHAAVTGH